MLAAPGGPAAAAGRACWADLEHAVGTAKEIKVLQTSCQFGRPSWQQCSGQLQDGGAAAPDGVSRGRRSSRVQCKNRTAWFCWRQNRVARTGWTVTLATLGAATVLSADSGVSDLRFDRAFNEQVLVHQIGSKRVFWPLCVSQGRSVRRFVSSVTTHSLLAMAGFEKARQASRTPDGKAVVQLCLLRRINRKLCRCVFRCLHTGWFAVRHSNLPLAHSASTAVAKTFLQARMRPHPLPHIAIDRRVWWCAGHIRDVFVRLHIQHATLHPLEWVKLEPN